MQKTLKNVAITIFILAMLDALILFTALDQLAMEGRTGYWAPFWRVQAEWVVRFINL